MQFKINVVKTNMWGDPINADRIKIYEQVAEFIMNKMQLVFKDFLHDYEVLFHSVTENDIFTVETQELGGLRISVGVTHFDKGEFRYHAAFCFGLDLHWIFDGDIKNLLGCKWQLTKMWKAKKVNIFTFLDKVENYINLERVVEFCKEAIGWCDIFNRIKPK